MMTTSVLQTLIVVFLLLTVILVWFGVKSILYMHHRNKTQRERRNRKHPAK